MAHLLYAGRLLGKAKMAGNIAAYLPSSIALSLQGQKHGAAICSFIRAEVCTSVCFHLQALAL